jgi:hypothetical protein
VAARSNTRRQSEESTHLQCTDTRRARWMNEWIRVVGLPAGLPWIPTHPWLRQRHPTPRYPGSTSSRRACQCNCNTRNCWGADSFRIRLVGPREAVPWLWFAQTRQQSRSFCKFGIWGVLCVREIDFWKRRIGEDFVDTRRKLGVLAMVRPSSHPPSPLRSTFL